MAKTKAEIRDRALQKLGKLAAGQTAKGLDKDTVDDAYDQVYARLERRGLVSWAADSVPDEFVEDIVAVIAFERSEGVPQERYARLASDARRAQVNIAGTLSGHWENPREVEDF